MRKRKRRKRKILPVIMIIILIIGTIIFLNYEKQRQLNNITLMKQEKQLKDILNHYNKYVVTNKETKIYKYQQQKYQYIGKINTNQELKLEEQEITYKDEYFKLIDFDEEYYIYYKDVDKIDSISTPSDRYKKYIVFNENIITKEQVKFYDEEDNFVYEINKLYNFPIIIKKNDKYGIEYNNKLLYIKKEDVDKKINNVNTNEKNTPGIAVLNYHFFYDDTSKEDAAKCNQIICLSKNNLRKHLNYIQENNIFTPTMKELEMYIDEEINLPKSVVLTIDDGWRADIGSKIIDEYKLNATVFLISKDYDKNAYKTNYIEVHSHGNNLHNPGVCPGGQGGGIKCLSKNILLEDLQTSREKLDNTTVFCYPFYEYNNYSIEVLKEAGFTMAFGGNNENGHYRVSPKINKFRLPRYVIYRNTTADNIKSYIN